MRASSRGPERMDRCLDGSRHGWRQQRPRRSFPRYRIDELEIVHQQLGRGVAVGRIRLRAAIDDPLERFRDRRIDRRAPGSSGLCTRAISSATALSARDF